MHMHMLIVGVSSRYTWSNVQVVCMSSLLSLSYNYQLLKIFFSLWLLYLWNRRCQLYAQLS